MLEIESIIKLYIDYYSSHYLVIKIEYNYTSSITSIYMNIIEKIEPKMLKLVISKTLLSYRYISNTVSNLRQ